MRWGIRTSLVLGLTGLLAVAGGVAALVVVRLVGGEAESQVLIEQRARAAAEAAAVSACSIRLADADPARCVARPTDGVHRRLAGPGGRWWVGGQDPPSALVLDVLEGGAPGWAVEGDTHRVVAPVALGGRSRAALALDFDLGPLRAAVAARQRTALWYLLFDLLAVLLFGIYVSGRALVRPMVALTRAVEQVGEGRGALPAPTGPAELWRLHEAFAAMLGRLEAARVERVQRERLAMVGRLAAGVAHEVGNPLAGVMGYVEFLRDPRGCSDAQREALLARMDAELGRMRDTLRGLLDLSRPTAAAPGRVALGEVAREAGALVRFQRAMAGVELVVEGEAVAWVDAGQLRQVFVNLLLNAADAMGGEGRVTVALAEVEGEARAVVRDAGPGVDPALVETLFEPFVTARASGEGTGLGLAISRRLVEEAGGRLWLDADAGPGATFVISLPTAP